MPDSRHTGRLLPSDLTVHAVGTGDAELVRLFIHPDRLAEIVRTGVLGHAGPDGTLDLTLDQFVQAAVDRVLTTYVTYGPDGEPATFVFIGEADPHTVTGGCINAPGVPGGRGFASSAVAVLVERAFDNPAIDKAAVSVYRWNVASIRMLERIGAVPAPAGTLPVDSDAIDADESVVYVLYRDAWPGLERLDQHLRSLAAGAEP
jgi:hypothetical protein